MKAIFALVLIVAVSAVEFQINVEVSDTNPVADFLAGFLKGIGESKDADDLIKCIRNIEHILVKIEEAVYLIMELELKKMIQGIEALIEAVKELSQILSPCTIGYETLKLLIEAIIDAEFNAIVQKFIQNAMKFFSYITVIISAFESKQYENAGFYIGKILRELFVVKLSTPNF